MTQVTKVQQLQARLDALKSLASQPGSSLDHQDIEELSTAVEQLQIVELEIRHHNAELASARDQLDAERLRYRDLFEMAPDAYLITDTMGIISEANRACSPLLRMERKFLIGKPLQVFIPSSERTAFRSKILHAQDPDFQTEWRLRVQPREGDPVDVAAAVSSIGDRYQTLGLRWSLRDITTIVRDEERLRDLNAELERRVADRTSELEAADRAKDDFLRRERAARDAAEEANRSKDDFLATISHELRTPLNVVLGWTFRLRSHTLDGDQTETAIEAIDRNARQQLLLVEELLDSARIANGRFDLELERHELGPLLRGAVEALEAPAIAKGIGVAFDIRDGIYVSADASRMRQVAWNLLSNALKFTPEKGRVRVSLACVGSQAVFAVADSGIGIPALALPHVFEPFWQAEPSTRRARGGLGLGLAIVKHLVELHGGQVEASSDGEARGARFTVRLPIAVAESPEVQQPVEA